MSRILARNLSLAARASGAGRSHLDGNVPGPWKTVKFGAPEFSFEEDGTKMVQTATHPEKESKSLTEGGIPETFYDAKKSYQKSARSYAVHPGEFEICYCLTDANAWPNLVFITLNQSQIVVFKIASQIL